MAIELATAYISLVPSAKNFGPNLAKEIGKPAAAVGDQAGASAGKRFSGKFALAAKVGLLAAGAGVVGFAKSAISAASDVSESQSKVGVVFGKQAGQIVAASKTSATAMGLSSGAYLEATGTLGNLLVSLNVAPKAAADMSQQMVKLAGDLASFNNVSPEEALAAIKSGLTGETEPLKAFGVNMNDATLHAQALKLGLIKNVKDGLSPQAKALAAQALIMDQTKTAQGDFGRTSGGLANQQRILTAQFDNVKAKVGAALLPVMVKLANFLTSTVLPVFKAVTDWAQRNASTLKIVAFAVSPLLAAWGAYVAITKTAAIAQAALDAVLLANPLVLVVASVAALVAAVALVATKTTFFQTIWKATWGAITKTFGAAFDFIKDHWKLILGILTGPIGLAVVFVTTHWSQIKDVFAGVFNWVKQHWPLISGILTGGILPAIKFIKDHVGGLLDFFAGIPGKITHSLSHMWDVIHDSFVAAVNFLIRGWNSLEFKIPGFDPPGPGPKFGGFTLGLPDIPELRAKGGPVTAGMPYIVGERRPELFVPNQSGRIEPRVPTGAGRGSGNTYHFYEAQDTAQIFSEIDRREWMSTSV